MKLFKFVDSRGVDILKNERIKFSPPQEFKDPFEMQMGITNGAAKRFAKQLKVKLEKQAEREIPGYKNLSHRQRKMGRMDMVNMSETVAIIKESFRNGGERQSADIGILSLCEFNNSNLMWYHYADGHRGFVVEFDDADIEFQKLGTLSKVKYESKQPVYDDLRPNTDFYRFKPNYLLHENEYRIIDYLRNCTPQKDEKGATLFFRSLPRKCESNLSWPPNRKGRARRNSSAFTRTSSAKI